MACCTLKPLLMADAINSSSNSSISNKTKSHFIQTTRNSQYYFSMIRLNTRGFGVKLYNHHLSCGGTQRLLLPPRRRPPPRSVTPPSFSLLNEVISSLAQCLSSNSATDDDDHQAQDQQGKDSVHVLKSPLLEDAFVLQVICEFSAFDLGRPCSRTTTNGFIIDIEGRRLLTSAQGIEHYSDMSIQKQGSNTIGMAIATAHDINLVSDDEFWEGVGNVELGDMSSARDELTFMSYVESLNTTTCRNGFVSLVAMLPFSHGAPKLPTFERLLRKQYAGRVITCFNKPQSPKLTTTSLLNPLHHQSHSHSHLIEQHKPLELDPPSLGPLKTEENSNPSHPLLQFCFYPSFSFGFFLNPISSTGFIQSEADDLVFDNTTTIWAGSVKKKRKKKMNKHKLKKRRRRLRNRS